MGEDWSHEEVEATVADYFNMLDKQHRGIAYNKSEHRRQLAGLLNQRSDAAIERKHQNISAILLYHLRFPPIPGYKPLRNYQKLLFDIVSDRLKNNRSLLDLVRVQVAQPAVMPIVDDILAALVDPPAPDPLAWHHAGNLLREQSSIKYGVDYIAQEAQNHSLGASGEQFVVQFEIARLIRAGKEGLASKVEHVSATQGDSVGFDVLSFDISGCERLIEVKTTAYGAFTPFFVTRNELAVSHKAKKDYYLYRAFEFRGRPKLFTKQGPLDQSFTLAPLQYIARVM